MSKICKHKFKPRYNEVYTTVIEELLKNSEKKITEVVPGAMVPYLKEKIYLYDICIKCGMTVGRKVVNEQT